MSAQKHTVHIDEEYSYHSADGRVSLLRHGTAWINDPDAPKAWIAAANQIDELRDKVEELEKKLEAPATIT